MRDTPRCQDTCRRTVMLTGFYRYFSLHHCQAKLGWILDQMRKQWIRTLRRQSPRHWLYWCYRAESGMVRASISS